MLHGGDIMVVIAASVEILIVNGIVVVRSRIGVGASEFHCVFVLNVWSYQSQSWQCQ